jgi:hypothetical protein
VDRQAKRLGGARIVVAAWMACLALGALSAAGSALAQEAPGTVCLPNDGSRPCEAVPPGPPGTPCFCAAPDGHGLIRGHRN